MTSRKWVLRVSHGPDILSGVQAAGQVQVSASVYQPASISRVFIGVQPGRGLARLPKAGKPSGPMSLVCLYTLESW